MSATIESGVLRMHGVEMRCGILEDGQRVIKAEDVERFFQAMSENEMAPTPEMMEELAKWTVRA